MKSIAWIAITLIAATALAGCTQQPAPPGGTPSSVTITRAPESAAANSQTTVCWRVEGSGQIPHTAVHTDTQSHPNSNAFADYAGKAYYPNNASSAAPVNLPGEFCTAVQVGTQALYLRAHAMQGSPGVLSAERTITVRTTTPAAIAAVTLGQYNNTAPGGSEVPVCWTVTGTGNVPHTAIHFDNVSHPTATSFDNYAGGALYPNNASSVDTAGYDLPGTFCTNVDVPMNGTVYFRAHAMTTTPPGMMSAEGRITANNTTGFAGIATTVTFEGAPPATAARGSQVLVCWRVSGTGVIPETRLLTDTTSHATELTNPNVYAGAKYYPGNTTAPNTTGYNTSGTVHCTNVTMPSVLGQSIYLRAHARDEVTGAPGKMSPNERTIAAT